ncbi:MAG: ABC transporter ATP-binding protein [Litoreibacter sp.]|nr:ABC transporter ATP-binding protein [Litoreibacter sp.]
MKQAPALQLEGAARFGTTPVFGPLTLQAAAGRWTCLLGPSGVGKSTILRLIAGLDQGIEFDGQITASDGQPVQGRVAMMAQNDLLMPWLDLVGNAMLGARLRGETMDRAAALHVLERVGLAEHVTKKPDSLSGGQRQRVALARTLMEDRPVVLLDEPFSALDARTRALMQELAVELLDGRTVLLITHDPAEAARLGHDIRIMTGDGLEAAATPQGAVPRAVDDPTVLQTQAALLSRLREAA